MKKAVLMAICLSCANQAFPENTEATSRGSGFLNGLKEVFNVKSAEEMVAERKAKQEEEERKEQKEKEDRSKEAFNRMYQDEALKTKLCYSPAALIDDFKKCISGKTVSELRNEDEILERLYANYISKRDTSYANIDVEPFRNEIQKAVEDKQDEEREKEAERIRRLQDDQDKQFAEEQRMRDEKENAKKKMCGKDYGSFRVGESIARVKQCFWAPVRKTGQYENGVEVYSPMGWPGTVIMVRKGLIISWQSV